MSKPTHKEKDNMSLISMVKKRPQTHQKKGCAICRYYQRSWMDDNRCVLMSITLGKINQYTGKKCRYFEKENDNKEGNS